jgi:peptide/nickel transport system substrate-binding protein
MADDIIRFWKSPWSSRFEGVIKNVYADGDSVVIEIDTFTHALLYYIGYEDRAVISPVETEEAGPEKWENQVGTGPFMFDEYVVGSYMRYKKNPDYWKSTTIDGKEYELPFVDQVVLPIIPDESTRIAALKTGKMDFYREVPLAHWETLDQVENLIGQPFSRGTGRTVHFRYDEPPFDNPVLRKAMAIGTDRSEFQKLFQAEDLPVDFFPFYPGTPAYEPLKDRPKEIQELYEYNPEKAKKLLAEAGYPNGLTVNFTAASDPLAVDMASLLKDMWAKIGVNINIKTYDPVAYTAQVYPLPAPKYHGAMFDGTAVDPIIYFAQHWRGGGSGGSANRAAYYEPEFNAKLDDIMLELDPVKQTELLKEAGLILQMDNPSIPLALEASKKYWWPWVKNYYGETTVTDDAAFSPLAMLMWIDQGLKKSMGY